MRYRVQSGRPVVHTAAAELDAVRCALRRRDDGFALAMTFDPGDAANLTLTAHAADLMLGLMHLRGWRHAGQEMRIATAADWTDRWWDRPLGPEAFVVESDLAPTGAADVADIDRIITLTMIAWCMERELYLHGRPVPDLMTAGGPRWARAREHPPRAAARRDARRAPEHHRADGDPGGACEERGPRACPDAPRRERRASVEPARPPLRGRTGVRRARGHLRRPPAGDRPHAPAPDARERHRRLSEGAQ